MNFHPVCGTYGIHCTDKNHLNFTHNERNSEGRRKNFGQNQVAKAKRNIFFLKKIKLIKKRKISKNSEFDDELQSSKENIS